MSNEFVQRITFDINEQLKKAYNRGRRDAIEEYEEKLYESVIELSKQMKGETEK